MSDVIKLVKGDNRPIITLTLTDEVTGNPIDVSVTYVTTVQVKFRKVGTTTILATITCTLLTTGVDGKVQFKFSGTILDVDPGNYEGEIVINYVGGDVETIYDVLRFKVKEDF